MNPKTYKLERQEQILKNSFLIVVILMVCLTIIYFYQIDKITRDLFHDTTALLEQMDQYHSDILYNPDNADQLVNGVYFSGNDYYCVSTYDRDFLDIRYTDYHEMCHAFIRMDNAHFCKHQNQSSRNISDYIIPGDD